MKIVSCLSILIILIARNAANGQVKTEIKVTFVRPAETFNPANDAEILQKATKGWSTDEKAIVAVIGKRNYWQRSEIARSFKTAYGRDLIDTLSSASSGNLKYALTALMTPPLQYYANELRYAVYGLGTDEDIIIESLLSLSNNDIRTVSRLYLQTFGTSLEADLKDDTSGTFQKICVSLVQGNRNTSVIMNRSAVLNDANTLYEAGAGRASADEFHRILVTGSFPHLKQVFKEYERIAGQEIEKTIKKNYSGWAKEAYLAIVQWCKSKVDYFVERLKSATSGYFTKHRTLTRTIVSRSEIDLHEIQRAFANTTGKSLESAIEGATSGAYKDLLILVASN